MSVCSWNGLKVKCNCGRTHKIDFTSFDIVESEEREQGPEITYETEEYTFTCDCGKEIIVQGLLYEYPVGILNYNTIEGIENAEVVRMGNPEISID